MLAVTSMIIDCGDVDEAVGQNRDADGFHRYHSWVYSPPPQSSLPLSPTNVDSCTVGRRSGLNSRAAPNGCDLYLTRIASGDLERWQPET